MLRRLVPPLLALLLTLPAVALADDEAFPRLSGRVVDEAEILGEAAEAELVGLLAGHEAATGNQVVVVTLSSLRGSDIADYGLRLGSAWGIGQEGRDKGLLLILAPTERAVRIEVGAGLEGIVTPALARLIIEREILPAVQAGSLEAAVLQGTRAILAALGGGYLPPPEPRPAVEPLGIFVVGGLAVGFLTALVWSFLAGLRRLLGHAGSGPAAPLRQGPPSGTPGFGGGGGFRGAGASARW